MVFFVQLAFCCKQNQSQKWSIGTTIWQAMNCLPATCSNSECLCALHVRERMAFRSPILTEDSCFLFYSMSIQIVLADWVAVWVIPNPKPWPLDTGTCCRPEGAGSSPGTAHCGSHRPDCPRPRLRWYSTLLSSPSFADVSGSNADIGGLFFIGNCSRFSHAHRVCMRL